MHEKHMKKHTVFTLKGHNVRNQMWKRVKMC